MIFNTHQGAQFTANAFTTCLLAANILVGVRGLGRALDKVFWERLSRSVESKNISLNQHDLACLLQTDLTAFFDFYSHGRPHPPRRTKFSHSMDQTLGPTTP